MNYILTNISYTGDMIWQKTFATDTIPFRQVRNRGQRLQYFAEDCHPPIVSRDEFQRVQSLMAARREQFTRRGKARGIRLQQADLLRSVRVPVPQEDHQREDLLGLPPARPLQGGLPGAPGAGAGDPAGGSCGASRN